MAADRRPNDQIDVEIVALPVTDYTSPEDCRINSAARSGIINVGEFVLPDVIVGITDASATRKPSTPITRSSLSTTAREAS